ncbi:hypothetical protein RF11_07930 [Thelohanellus kitauei]|uniref:Uncharacterized protein n=1 Tax=Thelohanellus kitauei TaxID=669202 RepID=A0A0C2MCL4_THEKT|nr:hypothetical protein RF11_07930 [Thelohanellus kitauei]
MVATIKLQPPALIMYEVPEGSPTLPAGGQTENEVFLSPTKYPPAAVVCVSLFGKFGYFAFPTPSLPVVNTLRGIGPAVFERANLSNPYFATLLGYLVHAKRDLALSRPAIIAWPASLSSDSPVRRDSIKGL